MKKLGPASVLSVLVSVAIALSACGDSRSLQSVSIAPSTAASQAQFTATGTYNKSPTSMDITNTTTWCIGTSDGTCVGNIAVGATVNAGAAQCLTGFSGTVTILAGQPGLQGGGADMGIPLKPFGVAQLICP